MAFDRSIIDRFERGGELLRQAVAGLTPQQLQAYPVPGTWSIHEVVVHMMDSDAVALDRMKRVIAEDLPLLLGYNESKFVRRLHPHLQPVEHAIDAFDLGRKLLAITLKQLRDEDFDRAGIHNEAGRKTLGEFVELYVDHLDHHLGFIAKKRDLLLNAKPHLGRSDEELIADYEHGPATLRTHVGGLSADDLKATPGPGKWSTQQVIIHIADADLAFAHRLKRIIAEDKPIYDAWSENDFIAHLSYDAQSIEDAIVTIEATHRQLMRVIRALPAGWLDRVGVHSQRGEQTARVVLDYATWHVAHHLKFVKGKREKLGKPLAG